MIFLKNSSVTRTLATRASWLSYVAAGLLAALPIAGWAQTPETPIAWDWQSHVPPFKPDATPSDTPILLYFDATWCGFCKEMDRTTLADPTVRMQIAPLTHIKVDYDQEEDLVKQFGIDGVPAFLLVNERGDEISRQVGATDALTFVDWLKDGEKKAADIAQQVRKTQEQLQTLEKQAAANDPAAQAGLCQQAFGFLGRGEPAAQNFATGYLGKLASSNPNAVIDGLQDPDLAVRIAVANILREKLGDKFDFDPWGPSKDREKQIAQLRSKLAAPDQSHAKSI